MTRTTARLFEGANRLRRRVFCGWLNTHSGPIESYGDLSYVDCERCGRLRQPMPRYYAEYRFGTAEETRGDP